METKSKKGFTLVEIMIVVVIIGLLAAMAIPAFQKVRETSQKKTMINNLRQIASGADQYFLEEGKRPLAWAISPVPTTTSKMSRKLRMRLIRRPSLRRLQCLLQPARMFLHRSRSRTPDLNNIAYCSKPPT